MFAVNFDQGRVISVGDGIANINGLNAVMSGELLFFPRSALKGIVLKGIAVLKYLNKKMKNTFTSTKLNQKIKILLKSLKNVLQVNFIFCTNYFLSFF